MSALEKGRRSSPGSATVVDGELARTSVSAMQTFRSCPRKWYFQKVMHLPEPPPGKGILRGLAGHSRLEQYFKTQLDVLDPLERMGLAYLPPPGPLVQSEVPIGLDIPTPGGAVPLIGFIDLVCAKRVGAYHFTQVIDFKFKSSVDKWGSSADDLLDPKTDAGLQMTTYALATPPADATQKHVSHELVHLTFQTKGRREVVRTAATAHVDNLIAPWEAEVIPLVSAMQETAQAKSWSEVKGNTETCGKYGGCPFQSTCYDPLARFTAGLSSGGGMGLLSRNKDVIAAETAASAAPVYVSTPSVTPAPTTTYEVALPVILPPDAPSATAPFSSSASVKAETPAPDAQASVASTVAGEETIEPAKTAAKRGRKAKDAVALDASPAAPVAVEASTHLYYGCAPVGVETKSLLPLTLELEAEMLKGCGVTLPIPDLRLATGEVLGFGRWKAALAACVKTKSLPPGHYVVSERDERVLIVAEEISKLLPPGAVVRGLVL